MSKRRRVLCIVLGLLMLFFGITMGWSSSFLAGRVGSPSSYSKTYELMDQMKADGTVFGDEEAAQDLLFEAIYGEVERAGEAQSFAFYHVGFCGLLFIGFALIPSRNK